MIDTKTLKNLADWELIEIKDTCFDILEERKREKKANCVKKFEEAFYNLKENNIDIFCLDEPIRFEDFTFE